MVESVFNALKCSADPCSEEAKIAMRFPPSQWEGKALPNATKLLGKRVQVHRMRNGDLLQEMVVEGEFKISSEGSKTTTATTTTVVCQMSDLLLTTNIGRKPYKVETRD